MFKKYLKGILASLFLISSIALFSQNVGINTTGASPSTNAILDLNTGNTSRNVGVVFPRVIIGSSLIVFNPPMANAPTALDSGMVVFNSESTYQPVGYYYWSGGSTGTWVSMGSGGGGGGTVTAANDGTSLNGTTVILGNAFGGTAGQLLQNTEIPFNGFNLTLSGTVGKFGIDIATNTSAAQAIEIGQTNNTMRINGLKAGATYNISNGSAPLTAYMMFANTNGDLNAMAAGATGQSLIWTATGPTWGNPVTSATAWQIIGNAGIAASTSAVGAAANNNFIGTLNTADFVMVADGLERMRIANGSGFIGINTIAPGAQLDVQGLASTAGTIENVTGNSLTTGTGLTVNSTSAGLTGNLLLAQSASTGAPGNGLVRFNFTGAHTNNGFQIDDVTTGGTAMTINANSITTTAGNGLVINANGMTSATGNALLISSTGVYMGANGLFALTSSGTTGTLAKITGNSLSTGTALNINSTSAYTGANGLFALTSSGTTGTLANITGNSLSTGTALNINSTSAYTGANGLFALTSSGTTGTLANITGNSLSTGTALNINSTSAYTGANGLFALTSSGTTGTLAKITGNSLSTGTALNINSTSAYTGANGLFALTSSGTTGTLANITGNSLTTGKALTISTNAISTGNGELISSTSTAGNGSILLNLTRSGTNATAAVTNYGLSSTITNTNATGGTNIAGYFSASGAAPITNYAIIVPNGGGSVGIATNAPNQALEIGQTTNTMRIDGLTAGSTFNVTPSANTTYMMYANSNGDVYSMPAGANNSVLEWTATGPIWGGSNTANTGGPIGSVLSNSAANTPAWNLSPITAGQLLLSNNLGVPTWLTTPLNGILYSNSGTPAWSVLGGLPVLAGILPIANGGTNTNAIPTLGGVAYGTGTAYAFTAVGAPGDFLMSNGAGTPTWATISGGSFVLSADNGLSWVNPNVQLGGNPLIMNTSIPLAGFILDITGNGPDGSIINLNDQETAGAVNIGSIASIININEYGNYNLNVNNAAFTTNIGTGTTTGDVLIGGASNLVGVNEAAPVSTLDVNGSYGVGTTDIAPAVGSSTALTNAYSTAIATPSAVATTYTLTLPSAPANPRKIYTVVYNGNGLGTIDITSPIAGNIIQGGATINPFLLTSGSVVLQSDGTNWNVTGSSSPSSLGQQIIMVNTTGSLTNPNPPAVVPGLTTTFTITSPEYALINTSCAVLNNTGLGSRAVIGVFFINIDGNQNCISSCTVTNASNLGGVYTNSCGTWGQLLAPGTHTISLMAYDDGIAGVIIGAAPFVSGDYTLANYAVGTMTISLLHQ